MRKLLLFIPLLMCWACQEEVPEKEMIRPVRYQQVSSQSATSAKTFSGTAEAETEMAVSFKVSGNIEELKVKMGEQIDSGALIARLDEADYRLQYEQALASLYQARAKAKNASSNYERFQLLYENNNVSLSEYQAAQAEYESAQATLRAQSKQVEQARLQLDYTTLEAPMNGIVSKVPVEKNENITAGQTIVTFSSTSGIDVKVDVPDVYIPYIKNGDTVQVSFSAMKTDTLPARVSEVSYSKGELRSSYPVTVSLLKDDARIRPGMAANVRFQHQIQRQNLRQAVLVPSFAVGEDKEGNKFVFVLEENQENSWRVRKRAVSIGEMQGDQVAVLEGLEQGEKVVTAGLTQLEDGMEVSVMQ